MSSTRESRRIAVECQECGKTTFAFKSDIANGRGKHCSQKCAMKARARAHKGIPQWIAGAPPVRVPVAGIDPKHYGTLAEIMASAWLIQQGYEVFRNISWHGLADLVAWRVGEHPILIDVKTCSPRGHISFTKPSPAQAAAGVKILYVDRITHTVSFSRQDFGPFPPPPGHAARYRTGLARRAALAASSTSPSQEGTTAD